MVTNLQKVLSALENNDLITYRTIIDSVRDEKDSDSSLELAQYLESIGFLDDARELYLTVVHDFPEVNLSLAQIAAEDGLIEEAFLYLDAIAKDSPYYSSALMIMADLYDMEGLADVAREKLKLATTFSRDPLIIFALAEIELSLENYQNAIKEYAKLDQRSILEQTGISTYQRIGISYAAIGKFEAAIEFLEKSVSLHYEASTAFELASLLYEQEQYQKAILYLKQIDTLNQEFDGYELLYAKALHAEHKVKEALILLQQGIRKNGFQDKLLLEASKYAYELHDIGLAEDYLLKAYAIEEDEAILLALTNLYIKLEDYNAVLRYEQDDIEEPMTLWNIAKAYQELEKEDIALERFEALFYQLNNNPEFLKDYIILLRTSGYPEKMKEMLEHYQKLVPDDMELLSLLEE